MNRASTTELAHAPELAILIALDTLLEMTTVSIQLALPELELVGRGHELPTSTIATWSLPRTSSISSAPSGTPYRSTGSSRFDPERPCVDLHQIP